ncbi:MAG: hypothetical protein OJF61_000978 [Rhodanobacteraceae bacterium]|nr:MAG: hypothetical protein OJF61_000978 [Rhodanobacteraceae bacterium]
MHTNPQDIGYDPAKAIANEHKHGVSFVEPNRRFATSTRRPWKTRMRKVKLASSRWAWIQKAGCW